MRPLRRAKNLALRAGRRLQALTQGRSFLRLPLDDNLVVYTSVWHRAPRGNPLAIYRKQQEIAPELRGVWIVRKQDIDAIPEGIEYVTPRTADCLRVTATAKFIIDDANPPWDVPAREGQIYVQTHHGTALKYMGADRHYSGRRPSDETIVTMHRRAQRWTYSLTTSPYLTKVWRRAYQNDCVQLPTGFPRNDRLVRASDDERAHARERLGLRPGERAVLYMPTWRTRRGPKEADFDLSAFAQTLPTDTRLLVRDHYYHDRSSRAGIPKAIIDVSQGWEVEDLYLASDVLLTDYSSAMFDYALVGKPIVLFCYDWDRYRFERGTYFDVTADAPGPVAFHAARLVEIFRSEEYLSEEYKPRLQSFRDRFATYESGNAAEQVVRTVMLGENTVRPEPPDSMPHTPPEVVGWTTHPPVVHPEDPALEERAAPVGPTIVAP